MNKILCFDTAHNCCSVAVSINQKIVAYEQDLRTSMQAETLMVMIESALNQANIDYSELNYLATTVGPGSFTGIRVGLAAAHGIMHATGITGVAINSFEASYYRLRQQIANFDYAFIVINAYRNQQYLQVFNQKQPVSEAKLVNNIDIVNIMRDYNGIIACAGSGVMSIYPSIQSISNLICLPRFAVVKASSLIRLASDIIKDDLVTSLEPMYIRAPDAQLPIAK